METMVVLGLVAAAVYWTVRRQVKDGGSCACSGTCSNCPSQKPEQNLGCQEPSKTKLNQIRQDVN